MSMPSLTQEQLNCLGGLSAAADLNGYYKAAEEYGFAYGALAGGVVRKRRRRRKDGEYLHERNGCPNGRHHY